MAAKKHIAKALTMRSEHEYQGVDAKRRHERLAINPPLNMLLRGGWMVACARRLHGGCAFHKTDYSIKEVI